MIYGAIRKYLGEILRDLAKRKGVIIEEGHLEHFWARGYFVSTVGLDEEMVMEYIRHQEKADEQRDQMKLGL